MAIGASQRRDIGEKYASFIPEISTYAVDGAKIMINNGWLEKPPQSPDRENLIKD